MNPKDHLNQKSGRSQEAFNSDGGAQSNADWQNGNPGPTKNEMELQLTPKQKEVLEFIVSFSEARGYAPSQKEIAKHFSFKSLGTVQNYLVRLQQKGALQKNWNAKRGIQVLSPTPIPEAVPLPLLGRVAAGRPIEAVLDQETIDVPTSMLKQGEHFVLQVKGDSMIEDGILDGDYAIIKKQNLANNGQTVVALLENEATIKRFYKSSSQVELHPANSSYEPLVVDSLTQEFRIEGVLVGLIRRLE